MKTKRAKPVVSNQKQKSIVAFEFDSRRKANEFRRQINLIGKKNYWPIEDMPEWMDMVVGSIPN